MVIFSRRDFLRTTTALGLAGTALPDAFSAETASDSPRLRRKFTACLSCGAIGVGADQREAIRLAHRFGFEAVEPAADFLARLADAELQELLADMKAKKLAWGASGLSVDFRGSDAVFQKGMKDLPRTAQGLKRAGVTRVATWLSPSHASLTYVANFRQHARRLREVARVLADHGQRLGLEYVGPKTSWTAGRFPFLHTMAEMKDLIAEINQPNVGFLIDSWHWYTAGESQSDLLTLRNRDVVCVHLNDAPAGIPVDRQMDLKRELPCATGVIDLKSFFTALLKMGYDGPVVIEPFSQSLRAMPAEKAVETTAAAMKKAFALVE
jgi:sugar phosphate isomerase/epimerase